MSENAIDDPKTTHELTGELLGGERRFRNRASYDEVSLYLSSFGFKLLGQQMMLVWMTDFEFVHKTTICSVCAARKATRSIYIKRLG